MTMTTAPVTTGGMRNSTHAYPTRMTIRPMTA